jgi:hypothetical protein
MRELGRCSVAKLNCCAHEPAKPNQLRVHLLTRKRGIGKSALQRLIKSPAVHRCTMVFVNLSSEPAQRLLFSFIHDQAAPMPQALPTSGFSPSEWSLTAAFDLLDGQFLSLRVTRAGYRQICPHPSVRQRTMSSQ